MYFMNLDTMLLFSHDLFSVDANMSNVYSLLPVDFKNRQIAPFTQRPHVLYQNLSRHNAHVHVLMEFIHQFDNGS